MKLNLPLARGQKTLLGLAALAAVAIAVFGLTRISSTQEKPRKLPPIVSQVKSVEVVSARFLNEGEPGEAIELTIKNHTDRNIVYLLVEAGDERDTVAVGANGFREEGTPPEVVLPAKGTTTIEMATNTLPAGHALRVAAVAFEDGLEEGTKAGILSVRRSRERERNRKKGGEKQ